MSKNEHRPTSPRLVAHPFPLGSFHPQLILAEATTEVSQISLRGTWGKPLESLVPFPGGTSRMFFNGV